MSGSRTLRRRITKERATLPDGQVVYADLPGKPKRVKPGTARRRHIGVHKTDAYELTLHATKGWRKKAI